MRRRSKMMMRKWIRRWLAHRKGEKGQSIIILAFAMVMLLAFVGIAIDVGRLYGTRIQLSRALDAAALAGVMELPSETDADARARQFMHTNGIDPDLAQMAIATGGGGLGQSNYLTVTAQLPMETMFLRFVGWEMVEVPGLAVAEFKSPLEVYASQHTESGVTGVVNLNVFGQDGNPIYGDAFSPLYSSEKPGQSCSCSSPCSNNDWRVMLQGRNGKPGVYPFRIHVPGDYEDRNETSTVQVEILDPDSWNSPENSVEITHLDVDGGGTEWKNADGPDQSWTAMADTGDAQNPKWFVRMDQNVSFCNSHGYIDSEAVTTEYTLYYYKQDDRNPYEIGQYRVRRNSNTDLEWVIPGETPGVGTEFGSFRFDLRDYPEIAADEMGNRSFYLDVEGIDGPGGNGYDLWAGPPPTVTLPSNVNERNVYLLNEINEDRNPHSSGGVVVWGMGFLPLNVNTDTTYTITLGYVPPEAAGTRVRVSNFDLDRDTNLIGPGSTGCNCNLSGHHCFGRHLHYLLEGVPSFYVDGDVSCSSNFGEDVLDIPPEFYGGYLYAVFETAQNDTTDWMLEYLDVMANTYVRLIR
jgi:hypothetical protein